MLSERGESVRAEGDEAEGDGAETRFTILVI